jgi:hypothetical protein
VRINARPQEVLGFFNASTTDTVNYMCTDPKSLLRVWEFVLLPVAFLVLAAWHGDAGMVLLVLSAGAYLLTATSSRAINQALWARRVGQALAAERASNGRNP